jgi:GR25 family glycosyltransferase involved in LPS biosynthesis
MSFYPETWEEYLKTPVFVINLDKSKDRMESCNKRLSERGFLYVERWKAEEPTEENIKNNWLMHGSPKFDDIDPSFKIQYPKQSCVLSHLNCIKNAIDNNIEYFTIAEDDLEFHPYADQLAPLVYESTPKDYDICYMGSNIAIAESYNGEKLNFADEKKIVCRVPSLCTGWITYTLDGAKKLYHCIQHDLIGNHSVETLDIRIWRYMYDMIVHNHFNHFNWYVWNIRSLEKILLNNGEEGFIKINLPEYSIMRGEGIVVQDLSFSSLIKT